MVQSATFWLVLAVSAVAFWLLPKRMRMGFLALASMGYLATLAPWSVAALLAWSLAFYWLAPMAMRTRTGAAAMAAAAELAKRRAQAGGAGGGTSVATLEPPAAAATPPAKNRQWILPALILGILGYLFYFKYVPPLIAALGSSAAERHFLIPLGISYFTFKLIHYAVEVARGNIRDRSLQQFFCYIFLFPIFTAGPIERFDHFLATQDQSWRIQSTVEGLTRIFHGLIKKFFIAETAMPLLLGGASADFILDRLAVLPTWKVWGIAVALYLRLYMDFAAYSDIAIGASRLFGFRIMENFDWPVLAPNIGTFWKRWHVTLASWCQTYIYMPMLGLTRSPYAALYATFLSIGLWHAATFPWILWGLYHATGIAVYQVWTRTKRQRKWSFVDRAPWKYAGIPLTFIFVSAGELVACEAVTGPYSALRIVAKLLCINLPA